MTAKPAYLTAAEDQWEKVRHDVDATAEDISGAEDALISARADAEADGYYG